MLEWWILVTFATYAATYLLRYTYGPFDVFLRIRRIAGINSFPLYDDDGNQVDIIEEVKSTYLAKLFDCWWCLSTWIALAWMLFTPLRGWDFFIVWFASIGLAGFLQETIK